MCTIEYQEDKINFGKKSAEKNHEPDEVFQESQPVSRAPT